MWTADQKVRPHLVFCVASNPRLKCVKLRHSCSGTASALALFLSCSVCCILTFGSCESTCGCHRSTLTWISAGWTGGVSAAWFYWRSIANLESVVKIAGYEKQSICVGLQRNQNRYIRQVKVARCRDGSSKVQVFVYLAL